MCDCLIHELGLINQYKDQVQAGYHADRQLCYKDHKIQFML
jgi:hypothetical protein